MYKVQPENRMITSCVECTYEMDTLRDEMHCHNGFIFCTFCAADFDNNNGEEIYGNPTDAAPH